MTKEALRIRPLTDRDRAQPRFANLANDDVLKPQDKTVQVVSQNKYFSFDHVFGTTSTQEDVFREVGDGLIRKFIEGYNITILAYGQTSSGKTHTMGTATSQNSIDEGIVPRSMGLLFDLLQNDIPRPDSPAMSVSSSSSTTTRLKSARAPSFLSQPYNSQPNYKYTVTVSFIEIYNEDLHDLLNSCPPEESPPINIREDTKGNIYWTGVKEVQVQSAEDVLYFLEQGTHNRATGATDMNEKSSRSHAIFSVTLRQEKRINEPKRSTSSSRPGSRPASSLSNRTRASHTPKVPADDGEWLITVSKFHFVDLAGSERLKRTAAKGDRRKEGININAGLLALGNVISALANDTPKRNLHVPYRDSKLTRLLQDSLGGNATTVMIACVSPAEYNLAETMNTLQYANRARSVKNRSEKNEVEEWMTTDNIELLRSLIGKLKHEVRTRPSKSDDSSDEEHSIEQRLIIADLQRQVEELDVQASVTRERNRIVEQQLLQLSDPAKMASDFQHQVEPVIEEYEKNASSLESQLAMTKAALSYSELGYEKQLEKIEQLEAVIRSHVLSSQDLSARLAKLSERELTNESYILQIESKLAAASSESSKDQSALADLRSELSRRNESDPATEKYIQDLEKKLALALTDTKLLQERIETIEAKLEAKERTNLELLKRLQSHSDDYNASMGVIDECQAAVVLMSEKFALADAERVSLKAAMENLQRELTSQNDRKLEESKRLLNVLQLKHDATLKELEDTTRRYRDAAEQLDFMDNSRASSTTHESREEDYLEKIAYLQEQHEKEQVETNTLRQQLGDSKRQIMVQTEHQAKLETETQNRIEMLATELEKRCEELVEKEILVDNCAGLRETLADREKELETALEKIACFEKAKTQVDSPDMAERYQRLEEEFDKRLREEQKVIASLERERDENSQELERLKRRVREDEEIQSALDEENGLLRKEKEGFEVRLKEMSKDINRFESAVAQHEAKLNQAQSLHANTVKTLEEKKAEMEKLKKNKNGNNFLYEDRIQRLEKQINSLSDENAEYTSLSEELEKEINKITREQEELVQEKEGLAKQVQESLKALKIMEKENKKLRDQQTEDEQLIAELEEIKQENERSLNSLKSASEHSKLNIDTTENDLKSRLEKESSRADKESSRAEKAERINVQLEKQLDDLLKSKKSFMCF